MSWERNREKPGMWVRHPWKKKHQLRRLKDSIKEQDALEDLRWDLEEGKADSTAQETGT